MGLLNLLQTGNWNVEKAKAKPAKQEGKIIPITELMGELGVRTSSTIGTYETEENPDKRTIEHYLAMQDNDGTVRAITRLFSMPIQGTQIKILAAEGDKGEAEFIENVFLGQQHTGGMTTSLPFVIADMTRAIFEGFRLYEKVPQIITDGKYKGLIGWRKLAPRDSVTLELRSDSTGGFNGARQRAYFGGKFVDIILPPEKCILFTFQKERHPLYGESILKTAWYHYDKKHKLYYLAHKKAEIDAVGLKILKISKPTSEAEVSAAEETIDTIGVNSRVTIPPGFELEVNRSSASGYDVLPLIEHHDTQMMLSVLAQATQLGTKTTYGYTYGAGFKTQGEFIIQMLQSIMSSMEDTLNQWAVAPLIDWNFGTACYPKIKLMPLQDSLRSYLLDLFEKIATKDPSNISPEFIDELSKEAAEMLGLDIENVTATGKTIVEKKEIDAAKKALELFEDAKRKEADIYKKPAPSTDKEMKVKIIARARELDGDASFDVTFRRMGTQYAIKYFKNVNEL